MRRTAGKYSLRILQTGRLTQDLEEACVAKIKVRCSNCKHEFYMDEYENTPCPKCGLVARGPKSKR
jgi:Zn finger protein HypA/HybF involved in hydrogenase expression